MIKNISESLSRIESSSYLNFGANYYAQKQTKDALKKTNDETDSLELNPSSNPFLASDGKYQNYFREKYKAIYSFVKQVKQDFSKKGETTALIDDSVINSQGLVSRYSYNSTLPQSEIEKYAVEKTTDGEILKTFDMEDNLLSSVVFKGDEIFKIDLFDKKFNYRINLRKKNPFSRFFNTDKTLLKTYQKFDKEGNLLERADFSKQGKLEKYSNFNLDVTDEILFDTNNYSSLSGNTLIPLKYNHYKNDVKLQSLNYAYALPSKYEEYDFNTSKLIKVFNVQGLNSNVYKYSFYNSLSGNLVASGAI